MAAIYSFARTADDLADEGEATPAQRLADLRAYRADLDAASKSGVNSARWAQVFEPLRPVIAEYRLPAGLFTDLLSAFEQDVVKHRYADRAELLDYCRRSASSVGRLLLHLYRINSATALRQSDAICTALQLANFWQDLGVDTRRGRLYLPAGDCARHGIDPQAVLALQDSPRLRALVADMVGWARELMLVGAPLVHAIPGRAGWELRLVVQGGLRILEKISAMDFATLHRRPKLRRHDAPLLLWRALWMHPARAVVASESA